ncbi:MAG: carboxynorspermidine decarboxylase [Ruminococcus sp.]|jgi:carboxynorspermidine decarboxylase|nr:carboxynorspermidine decarboxylase [Ruminococcus sp.]
MDKNANYPFRTPAYVVDEQRLTDNLKILRNIALEADCKILLAQKAFSMYSLYPLISDFLSGTCSSGVYEAQLSSDKMPGRENHIYSAAYNPDDFAHIVKICDHIVFNNFKQFSQFYPQIRRSGKSRKIGIRINPEYSEVKTEIYNPCSPMSRLGCRIEDFPEALPDQISGFHFHTMCEQGADVLERTLKHVINKFGHLMVYPQITWLNFGGGHSITQPGYDIKKLIDIIKRTKKEFNTEIYLEPGEAVAQNAGILVSRVLDIVNTKSGKCAILDVSPACHMPDVLEMPYRPPVLGGFEPNVKPHTYILAGPTCLAGDICGTYSFAEPLAPGTEVVFCDMAIYTMVKNNSFNGMKLPSIYTKNTSGDYSVIKRFAYRDFMSRL